MDYSVDSFQLFFPCDEKLVDHFHANDLSETVGVRGKVRSTIPIVYCDNTVSTIKKDAHLRKYAFPAEYANVRSNEVGWENKRNGILIPSEDFSISIEEKGDWLMIEPVPSSNYHLEYKYKLETNMGKWENWFAIYMPLPVVFKMLRDLHIKIDKKDLITYLQHEKKQTTGKREDFYYTSMPVREYQFTYESFDLADQFLRKQGFNGNYKGLYYNGKNDESLAPVMKVGYVHTNQLDGDFNRDPQIAIKLTQSKMKNGTKSRGRLQTLKNDKSYIVVSKEEFARSILSALYQVKTNNQLEKTS